MHNVLQETRKFTPQQGIPKQVGYTYTSISKKNNDSYWVAMVKKTWKFSNVPIQEFVHISKKKKTVIAEFPSHNLRI